MPNRYHLPCECGQDMAVEPGQAGQMLACSCGRELEVPSMRGIRALEPYEGPHEREPARPGGQWNVAAGIAFAIGAFMIFGGLSFGGIGLLYRTNNVIAPPPQEIIDAYADEIDNMSSAELWDLWKATSDEGLGNYASSPFVVARDNARFYGNMALGGFAVASLGLLTIIAGSVSNRFF